MRRILITGATGYLGKSCLPLLLEAGYEIHAITRSTQSESSNGVIWHKADLLDEVKIETIIKKIKANYCLHLAWYTKHGEFWESSENIKWVDASISLLKIFTSCGGKRAVIAGSCAEYDWNSGVCEENATPLIPATLYGKCKHSLNQHVIKMSRMTGLEYAWARLFFIYGENEDSARLVPSVCCSLLKGVKAKTSGGEQQRDFMHVSDVSTALVNMLDSNYIGEVNVASGEAIAIRSIVMSLAELIGRVDLLEFGALKTKEGEPLILAADTTILNNEFSFIPSIELKVGLEQAVKFWESELNNNKASHAMPSL